MASFDYHTHFHNALGHVTTIRSALSVVLEDLEKLDKPTIKEMLTTADKHTTDLVNELNDLRNNVYKDMKI